MQFTIVGPITQIETIAAGGKTRELKRLKKVYGPGRWLKRKGFAKIRFQDGRTCWAEVHWYEAHGIGPKEYKIKRIDDRQS